MIPKYIIDELKEVKLRGLIFDPDKSFKVAILSLKDARCIGAIFNTVFISKRALKHIIDQRGSENLIFEIPRIVENPTKISKKSVRSQNRFLFCRMNGKSKGVVVEITKTPGHCQVVSVFPMSKRYYHRLIDISGRTAVPPFSTP